MIIFEEHENAVIAKFYDGEHHIKNIWRNSLVDLYLKYTADTAYDDLELAFAFANNVLRDRKLVGVAKCHPSDKFDLEEGKRIAKEDLLHRFNIAKTQLKKEILYLVRKDVANIKSKM